MNAKHQINTIDSYGEDPKGNDISLIQNQILDSAHIEEVLNILSDHFNQKITITSLTLLSEPKRRNRIIRIDIECPQKGTPKSIIFKQTCTQDDKESDAESLGRFSRDWAGLEFLSHIKFPYSPKFYGGYLHYRFVLLEDLGEQHISLVDSLTKDNSQEAEAALYRFVKYLGAFHAESFEKTAAYLGIVQRLNHEPTSWQTDFDRTLESSLSKFEFLFKTLAISVTQNLWEELKGVFKANIQPGSFTTLIHGDICPDNVFDHPLKGEMYLIDFEHSSVRSALLDGTYLRMSMPTCWCSKAIPSQLIPSLENTYREELKKKIHAANDDAAYHTAYVNACAFWMLKSILSIEKLLNIEETCGSGPTPENSLWKAEENLMRPRVLSRLGAFLAVSNEHGQLSHLRHMTEHVLTELNARWPEAKPLQLYPAFLKKAT